MGKMSFIRKNMVEGNTSYRPEQMYVAEILKGLGLNIKTEYEIKGLEPFEDISFPNCIPDIACVDRKMIFRLNGLIHEKPKQRMKDEDQKLVLEFNGWRVIDLTPNEHPALWNQKKYSYDEATKTLLELISNE
jgi:hypothetical protein